MLKKAWIGFVMSIVTITQGIHAMDIQKDKKVEYSIQSRFHYFEVVLESTKDYTAFDFETTGIHELFDEVIQIGAVKYRNDQEVDHFCTYVKPSISIPPRITKLTGISSKETQHAPSASQAFTNFIEFIGKDILVAHNAKFDFNFLSVTLGKLQLALNQSFRAVDTLSFAKKSNFRVPNYKLETLKKHLGIQEKAHDALADSRACAILYQTCRDDLTPSFELYNNQVFESKISAENRIIIPKMVRSFMNIGPGNTIRFYSKISNTMPDQGIYCSKFSARNTIHIPKAIQIEMNLIPGDIARFTITEDKKIHIDFYRKI